MPLLLLVLILTQKGTKMACNSLGLGRQTCHYAQIKGFCVLIHHAEAQTQ